MSRTMMNDSESRAAAGRTLDDMNCSRPAPFSPIWWEGGCGAKQRADAEPWMSRGD
jgi:hypothetical protein